MTLHPDREQKKPLCREHILKFLAVGSEKPDFGYALYIRAFISDLRLL